MIATVIITSINVNPLGRRMMACFLSGAQYKNRTGWTRSSTDERSV
jgi:hypothetical protein